MNLRTPAHRGIDSSRLIVGRRNRRRPLRTERTRLATAYHIGKSAAVTAVGLLTVQLLDLLAIPAGPGQPPPPSGDPGPLAASHHDHGGGHAQPAKPPPPTSTLGPARPGHDHHVLPLYGSRAASIARRQHAAYPRLRPSSAVPERRDGLMSTLTQQCGHPPRGAHNGLHASLAGGTLHPPAPGRLPAGRAPIPFPLRRQGMTPRQEPPPSHTVDPSAAGMGRRHRSPRVGKEQRPTSRQQTVRR